MYEKHLQIIQQNPNAAELFASIFHSFEAEIAGAVSNFKSRNIFIFKQKIDIFKI